MSYYTKRKFKIKRIRRIYDDMRPFERQHWKRRFEKHWKAYALPCDYSLSPSWWNRLYCTKPARRKTHAYLTAIYKGADPALYNWPDYKKPNIYYW